MISKELLVTRIELLKALNEEKGNELRLKGHCKVGLGKLGLAIVDFRNENFQYHCAVRLFEICRYPF